MRRLLARRPGAVPPSTISTVTLSARCSSGSAKALVRACSVLRFQWTRMLRPIVFGAAAGTISTGRPLSNSAASSGGVRGFCGSGPGPAQHDQVEDAAMAADKAVFRGLFARPAIGKDRRLLFRLRHLVALHEAIKVPRACRAVSLS